MPAINNFKDVNRALAIYIPAVKQFTGKNITLERMEPLMRAIGNPQKKLKIIHIAGTSGKTSTSYYIASLLKQSGKKVGLTVSPHVDSVAERIQLDLRPLNENEFCSELSEFQDLINKVEPQPSYFELLVAFAYWVFAKRKVDYAVVETGLGGLQDATNVAQGQDKICVITDIDLDHTEILGSTYSEIASQKAGIIHQHNAIFCYRQSEEIMNAIFERCEAVHAQIHEITPIKPSADSSLPFFQQRNLYLANEVYKYIAARDNLPKLSPVQFKLIEDTYIPARMERVKLGEKTIIIDGSHNAQKLHTLNESIKVIYGNQPIAALASFVESPDERTKGALNELSKISKHIIITSFSGEQDTPKRSVDLDKMKTYCQDLGIESVEFISDPKDAFNLLMKRNELILLITGSFYLLNHIRPLFQNKSK